MATAVAATFVVTAGVICTARLVGFAAGVTAAVLIGVTAVSGAAAALIRITTGLVVAADLSVTAAHLSAAVGLVDAAATGATAVGACRAAGVLATRLTRGAARVPTLQVLAAAGCGMPARRGMRLDLLVLVMVAGSPAPAHPLGQRALGRHAEEERRDRNRATTAQDLPPADALVRQAGGRVVEPARDGILFGVSWSAHR
jgi:hypothetical protein